ncbi:Serine/threonine-protein kinase PknD [Planctomycetes bacterium Pan216]|uniref:Serine/threonine-protein kinase PknD n=1 Tax=Kolteria novifilia TaxID=2527975 RepID=A0A518B2T5_9BACT|nr:Serine/threonine-protein kinase PknD [Planctomycetes bacterium Pan216]
MINRQDLFLLLVLLQDESVSTERLGAACAELGQSDELDFVRQLRRHGIVSPENLQRSLEEVRSQLEGFGWKESEAFDHLLQRTAPHRIRDFWAHWCETKPAAASGDTDLRYRFDERRGEGGIGTVWEVFDEGMERTVALKELKQSAAQRPSLHRRFLREGRITAGLQHPHIVPIYDFQARGVAGKLPYYTMPLLNGGTLLDRIRAHHATKNEPNSSGLRLRELLLSFVDVCEAIGYANAQGVIHRDVKPANVAIGLFGEVILIDWGLAKRVHDAASDTAVADETLGDEIKFSETTQVGHVVGTPAYMAPEQAAGDIGHVGVKTDIYGLGSTLFMILTGKAPHQKHVGEDVRAAFKRLASEPTPLARSVNPKVAPVLEAVCAKAMAFAAEDRYDSAMELAADINRVLAGEEVDCYHRPFARRVVAMMRRNPIRAQAVASLVLVVGVLCAVLMAYSWSESRQLNLVERGGLTKVVEEMKLLVDSQMQAMKADASLLASFPAVGNFIEARQRGKKMAEASASEQMISDIRALLKWHPEYLSVNIIDAKDQRIVRGVQRDTPGGSTLVDISEPIPLVTWWKPFLAYCLKLPQGDTTYSGVMARQAVTDEQGKLHPIQLLGAAVREPETDELIGAVVVEVDFEQILLAPGSELAKSATILVTDDQGHLLNWHGQPPRSRLPLRPGEPVEFVDPPLEGFFDKKVDNELLIAAQGEQPGLIEIRRLQIEGKPPGGQLDMIVLHSLQTFVEDAVRYHYWVIGVAASLFVIALVTTWVMVRFMLKDENGPLAS